MRRGGEKLPRQECSTDERRAAEEQRSTHRIDSGFGVWQTSAIAGIGHDRFLLRNSGCPTWSWRNCCRTRVGAICTWAGDKRRQPGAFEVYAADGAGPVRCWSRVWT